MMNAYKSKFVFIVTVLKDSDKFIPADAEYRAVLKYVADDPGGSFQVNISLVMPIFDIDHAETRLIRALPNEPAPLPR